MSSSLKKNLGYQTIYNILSTAIPLITSPYLARVLGADNQGIFSYTQSIVNYFTLFAMLGIQNYGSRTIASIVKKNKLSHIFWSLYIFQMFTSIWAICGYIFYLCILDVDNVIIAYIQILYLFGSLTDINWLFFGIERFDITVKRSIVIRLATVASIFLFVHNGTDLWKYTLIMSGGTFFSNLILWRYVPTVINFNSIKLIKLKDIKTHIRPNIILFVPILVMSIFHIMDKTMLGVFSTYEQTGFYYNADKIINIPIGVINGVGIVMLPRMSSLIGKENKHSFTKLFNQSLELIICISTAMSMGIAAVAKEFVPFFFGDGFDECVPIIIVLAPIMVIKGISQTIRMQYLVPCHKEKVFLQSSIVGMITNLCANIALIPQYGALGAVIGTLLAEITTCIWQLFKTYKEISYLKSLLHLVFYCFIGIAMFIIVRLTTRISQHLITQLGIEISVGVIVYLALCVIYWKISKSPIIQLINIKKWRILK